MNFDLTIFYPALIMGSIIGLIELFFVHADETGLGWLGHGLHALPVTILFVFISMHLSLLYKFIPFLKQNFVIDLVIRIIIGLIAMAKIAGAAALVNNTTIGEKKIHILLIGILIIIAPYVWQYIAPLIGFKLTT